MVNKNYENGKQSNNGLCLPFEEALDITGFGKFNIMNIFFSGTVLLGMILETLGFGFVIPACQCDFELTLIQKGWLGAIPFTGMILMCPVWGFLIDSYGRRKICMISMGIGCCLSIISSFSPNLTTFAILRFIASIFISGSAPISSSYLGEMNPAKYRDSIVTLANAFVAIASAVIPILAWIVLPTNFNISISFLPHGYRPWRLLVSLFAIPFIFCTLLFYFYFPESPKFLMSKGRSEEALEILKRMYKTNFGKTAKDFPVTKIKIEDSIIHHSTSTNDKNILKTIWQQISPIFRKPYLSYILLCFCLQFCIFMIVNGFYIWFPDILSHILNGEKFITGESANICGILKQDNSTKSVYENITKVVCDDTLHTSTFPISIALSCIVTVFIVAVAFILKIVNKKRVLMAIFITVGTCMLSLNWITNGIVSLIFFSVLQICETCIGLVMAIVVELFPSDFRGLAACIVITAGSIGSLVGTNTLGYLINTYCDMSFYIYTVFIYCTAILCLLIPTTSNKI